MTARVTFTQAELARAIRAAEACGKGGGPGGLPLAYDSNVLRRISGKLRPVARQCVTLRGGKRL